MGREEKQMSHYSNISFCGFEFVTLLWFGRANFGREPFAAIHFCFQLELLKAVLETRLSIETRSSSASYSSGLLGLALAIIWRYSSHWTAGAFSSANLRKVLIFEVRWEAR